MNRHKITVITVVYNSENLLEKTILSVVNQSYPLVEYIIIDGGSVDRSIEIIKKYEKDIATWVTEPDNGIYHAMNKGVKKATGDWVCFLNSGDAFVDDSTLQKVADGILQNPDAEIVYGNIFTENKDGSFREREAGQPGNKHRMYFCHQSAFTKTEILKAHPFDERHKLSADLKFFKECYYSSCRFVKLDFPVVYYDTSGISNTHREIGLRDNIAVIREIDRGISKLHFLLRLYFVIYWRKLTKKSER